MVCKAERSGFPAKRMCRSSLRRTSPQKSLPCAQHERPRVRLVTDTNVVVSGLLWLGNPGRLLEAAALGNVTLYTSPVLLAELSATLSRQWGDG